MSSFLYGVTARDLPTFLAAALLFASVASAATLLPARRAARIAPTVALRYD